MSIRLSSSTSSEMAQRSILSMFKKSNRAVTEQIDKHRLGNPVLDNDTGENGRTGKPTDSVTHTSVSDGLGNPVVVIDSGENGRTGKPTGGSMVQNAFFKITFPNKRPKRA